MSTKKPVKKTTVKKTKEIKGTYGWLSAEYFVAAELSRRDFCTSVTLKNTPGIDILTVSPNTEKMYFIQVKEKKQLGKTKVWILDKKDEQVKGDNFYYAFVNLNFKKLKQPDIYIVPSATVAKRIKEYHNEALAKGRKDTNMREFILEENEEEKYQNWDILK